MKNFTKTVLALAFMLTSSIVSFAQDTDYLENDFVEIGGIRYFLSVTDNEAYVEDGPAKNYYKGDVFIPESVTYKGEEYKVCGIDNRAFKGCTELKSVSIPGTVNTISHEAFMDCKNLETVIIGEGVQCIEYKAFAGCSSLTKIDFPKTIRMLGSFAFSGCTGITSVDIPEYMENIDWYVFSGCSNLSSIIVDKDNPTFNDGDGSNCIIDNRAKMLIQGCKNTIVPDGVKAISPGAFLGSGITSVSIPSCVESISPTAFSFCPDLMSVTVDKANPYYNDGYGGNCIIQTTSNILILGCKNSEIPDYVEAIGSYSFMGSTGLKSIVIPSGVKAIGDGVFMFCPDLESITVDKSNPNYSDGNSNCIIETRTKTLISGCKTSVIPEGVQTIGYNAFYGCLGLYSIIIPEGVTRIEENAFRECSSLAAVTIPSSMKAIDECAFWGCTNLSKVNLPKSKIKYGIGIFKDCDKLPKAILEEMYSASDSFSEDEGVIQEPAIPYDEVEILEPETPETYEIDGIFYVLDDSSHTASVTNTDNEIEYKGNLSIPEKVQYKGKTYIVTSISAYAFFDCDNLISISVPKSVISINSDSFICCKNLKCIIVSKDNPIYNDGNGSNCIIETSTNTLIVGCNGTVIPDNVVSIGKDAFYGSAISSISIPDNVKTIGERAFNSCKNLTAITIPNSVEKIGKEAFEHCDNLESVTLPNTITAIENGTFSYCYNLASITIPESVIVIEYGAFFNCIKLAHVKLPEGIIQIHRHAFERCYNLPINPLKASNCITFGSLYNPFLRW